MSFARRYRTMMEAQQAAVSAQNIGSSTMTGTTYELHLDLLANQKRQIKNAKSFSLKNELKMQFLPEWEAYLQGVLNANAGVQDQIIGQLMIWCIDVAEYDRAIEIATYMLKHNLALPEHFSRDLEDAFAEEMANAWINCDPHLVSLSQLERVAVLVQGLDMVDEVSAKLNRALGEAYFEHGDLANAQKHLSDAVEFNPRVGCKPLLQKVEKALNTQA
ncbi:phage terminase small subunit [Histophilus somni]|uniref:phage terminase small subunit n=1 Tax=Histophilus somni TaxID=731 RepID=UPI00201FA094|nr:phage terminase small subunit [Histophilus somni]